jgi:hypothetical protein
VQMSMKSTHTLMIVLFAALAGRATAQDMGSAECLVKVGSKWGTTCDACEYYRDGYKRDFSGTFRIELRNECREMVEVKLAVEEKDGNWRTFPVRTIDPGASVEGFACHGTGRYLYWVRKLNDTEIILPTDQEIITEYRSR